MNGCQTYQYNAVINFGLEKIIPLPQFIPQSVADFVRSYIPVMEVSVKDCATGLFVKCHQIVAKASMDGEHVETQGFTSCSPLYSLNNFNSKELIDFTTQVEAKKQELFQKAAVGLAKDVGLAAIALVSAALIGYGIYKLYRKRQSTPAPILQEPKNIHDAKPTLVEKPLT